MTGSRFVITSVGMMTPRASEAVPAAHDRVYRTLRTRIMHGEIAPGAALTLRGIGKEFDVSMTPAREAVRQNLTIPLQVAGYGDVSVDVRFEDEGAN